MKRLSLRRIIDAVDAELILIEGLKNIRVPRVFMTGNEQPNSEDIPQTTLALITWGEVSWAEDMSIPVVNANELDRIVAIIEQHAVSQEDIVERPM